MAEPTKTTSDLIHAVMAELGIVDPVSIAAATERHAEMIEVYKQGKMTTAALKHSLAARPNTEEGGSESAVVDHTRPSQSR
ncbi:hypothetical protein [Rhizobium sp. 2MFCol3.1]|uniref:hypothetical protein n=1 Tax=Rhizobium sp. 2MFCol3.1 TaxID=1246459 RepID=UPI00037E09D8|nr:hypothetical protein [Rhizobium sp. 2MFCol3.1]